MKKYLLLSIAILAVVTMFSQADKVIQLFKNEKVVKQYTLDEIDYLEVKDVIGVPTNLKATVNNGRITLTWEAVEGAQSYNIYRSASESEEYIEVASNIKATSWTDNDPKVGYNYYKVSANAERKVSLTQSASTSALIVDESMESGIYLGITGFNQNLTTFPIGLLNDASKQGYYSFIEGLDNEYDGTAIFYAVDQAINTLQSTPLPSDLNSVHILTFTDGIDNHSLELYDEIEYGRYTSPEECGDFVKSRLISEDVEGTDITAYSIGSKHDDVNQSRFTSTLQRIASADAYVYELDNMAAVENKFKEIARNITEVNKSQNISVSIAGGLANGERVRFTFDLSNNASSPLNSSLYIEGTFVRGTSHKITNIICKGLKLKDGVTEITGTKNTSTGLWDFQFEEVVTNSKILIDQTKTLEWWGDPWQKDTEFSPEENTQTEIINHSTAIILVLDCTKSLGSKFPQMQSAAKSFIDVLLNYKPGENSNPEEDDPEQEIDPGNETVNYDFSYANRDSDNYVGVGVQGSTTYNVAIRIVGEEKFIGKQILGVTVPIINEGASNISAWLTTSPLSETNYRPNIVEKGGTLIRGSEYGTATIIFSEPYTITEKGVFVGYSFTIDSAYDSMTKYPVLVFGEAQENSLYIACTSEDRSDVHIAWMDGSAEGFGASGIVVHMCDTNAPSLGLQTVDSKCFILKGESSNIDLRVVNTGAQAITSAEYTLEIDGKESVVFATAKSPIQYMNSGILYAQIQAPYETGTFTGTLKLIKVNGKRIRGELSNLKVTTVSSIPKHLPFMEELTATGCTFCSRGYAGMEALRAAVPDAIIAAYHTDVNWVDPMHLTSGHPSYVFASGGVPDGNIDRNHSNCDPYFGWSKYPLGIIDDYISSSKVFSPVEINVEANWVNDSKSEINIKSTVIFRALPEENYPLRILYTLTADDLSGTSSQWFQSNAYAGQKAENYPGMDIFTNNASGLVSGLSFNDVVVYKSGVTGIENSLPNLSNIKIDTPYIHEYRIKISDCINTSGNQIIQNINKLTVIASVLQQPNNESGIVLNSAQHSMYDKITKSNKNAKLPEKKSIKFINLNNVLETQQY